MTEQEKIKREFREEVNVRDLLLKYLSYWKWFALSLALSFGAVFFVLRYTPESFESKAKVLIEFEKAGAYSELYAFQDLGLFDGAGNYNNLYNEKEILSSRPLIESVIRKLKLNIQYNLIGSKTGIERRELYKTAPIEIVLANFDAGDIKSAVKLDVEVLNASQFRFVDNELFGDEPHNFKDTLYEASLGSFFLRKTRYYKGKNGNTRISILVRTIEGAVSTFQSALKIEPINEQVDVLELSIRGSNIEKNNDFLDSLIAEHTRQTINNQMKIYRNTTEFINDRIATISEELSDVEKDDEAYKSKYDFSDVLMSEKSLYDRTLLNERSLVEAEIQLEMIKYLHDFLAKLPDTETLLPANLGFDDYGINQAVGDYNRKALERMKLLEHSSAKNPTAVKIENELQGIKMSLKSSLVNSKASLQLEVNRLRAHEAGINAELSDLPKHKRVLRSMDRQQQVKEQLYVYLLQKREENEIASRVTEGNTKIIESAYSSGAVVSPNRKVYYAAALAAGLFLPFSLIYIFSLLDNKVRKPEDLESQGLTLLGSLPSVGKSGMAVDATSGSPEAEAFRILRTNTSFLLGRKGEHGQVLLTTSTIAQEGKSYVALNLGISFSLTGKKTLVVGLDLRAPKLLEYAGFGRQPGITDWMMNEKLELNQLIIADPKHPNLYFLSSGTIPPNPAEMLVREDIKNMIDSLRDQYDIIILDSAPVALVADTLLISHLADSSLFVVRANTLEKSQLSLLSRLSKEGKLKNLGVVLNAVTKSNNSEYGYGYGEQRVKKTIFKRLLKRR